MSKWESRKDMQVEEIREILYRRGLKISESTLLSALAELESNGLTIHDIEEEDLDRFSKFYQ